MRTFKLLMLALLLASGMAASAAYKIDRLEPAFWWAGMENSELQLLVYGEGISELRPEIKHEGITLEQTLNVLMLLCLITINCH